MQRLRRVSVWLFLMVAMIAVPAAPASAQVTPAAGYTPPDDTPSIRVGVTLFPNYTYPDRPEDHRRRRQHRQPERVRRRARLHQHHRQHLAHRRVPHHARHHARERVAHARRRHSVSSDSLVFRIKYAYAQFNLDDWMTRGSWARLGIQQTPWVDFEEGIYRYRFQGTVFAERIPLPTAMTSADAGASFHYNFPSNYGDVHVGVYNGENYQQGRGQRPEGVRVPRHGAAVRRRACRCCAAFARISSTTTTTTSSSDERKRVMGNVTFEHQYLNAGFDYLERQGPDAGDRHRRRRASGYSIWATPRTPLANGASWEGAAALRPLHAQHGDDARAGIDVAGARHHALSDQQQNRTIVGVAYWFPHQGNVSTAHPARLRRPDVRQHHHAQPIRSIAVHGLVNF